MKKILLPVLLYSTLITAQCFEKVVSGHDHILAISQNGTLWTWGENSSYQLGNSTQNFADYPVQVFSTGWTDIAGGENHSLGVKDGMLYGWGSDQYEQLGNGTNVGYASPQQIGTDNNWKQVAAGNWHSAAIKTDGTLWTWGSNWYGSLGTGVAITNEVSTPQKVGTDTNWKYVSSTYTHCVAVKTDGTMWAWGNAEGIGGNSGIGNTPLQITGNDWKTAEAGQGYILAIKNDGTLWAWGDFFNTNTFLQVGFGADWASISANKGSTNQGNYRYFLLTKTDGSLYAWGNDNYEQLGNGLGISSNTVPELISSANWIGTAASKHGSFAIKDDGTFWVWGNTCMDLQDNCATNTVVPSPVQYACTALSVAENLKPEIKLYPNPVADILNIQFANGTPDKIIITDISGKTVLEQFNNSSQVDVQRLSKGVYFIKIYSGELNWQEKFIRN